MLREIEAALLDKAPLARALSPAARNKKGGAANEPLRLTSASDRFLQLRVHRYPVGLVGIQPARIRRRHAEDFIGESSGGDGVGDAHANRRDYTESCPAATDAE